MTSEQALRHHLIDRLRLYDEDAADRLAGGVDMDVVERRLDELNSWTEGWRMLLCIAAVSLGVVLTVGPWVVFGTIWAVTGIPYFCGLFLLVVQWQRKKTIYEILAVLGTPEREGRSRA